jgi:monoamine oxidase
MTSTSPSSVPHEQADFVVVGAGFAGLTAALRLSEFGTVILLEARDRVGGRVKTTTLPNGVWLDEGGTWFGPGQTYAYELACEMGVETYPTWYKGESILLLADGKIVRKPENFLLKALCDAAAAEVVVEAGAAAAVLDELESLSKQVPLDAPWTAAKAHQWDQQSFAAWVDAQLDDSFATARGVLKTIMEGYFTTDTAEVSLLGALYLIHSHHGFAGLAQTQGGDQQDRIVGGAQAIADKIRQKLGDAVRLSSPVRQINQDADGVEVVADTVVVRAKRAVVAMPPTVAGRLRYEPPLPAERAMLVERVPSGEVIKFLVAYETPFWQTDGLSGMSAAVADPITMTIDGCTNRPGDPGLMIAFASGRHARALARLSKDERRCRVLDTLAKRFGPLAATPLGGAEGFFEHNWSTDQWSGGGMIAHFPPGVLTNFGPALRDPMGRIHWAGSESSSAFHCSINAAIESGERVCKDIVAAESGATEVP